jgi:hypothetical protein
MNCLQLSTHRYWSLFVLTVLAIPWSYPTIASDCSRISIGLTPINDLAIDLYLGQYEGGLYPGGSNTPPITHHDSGILAANSVTPLDSLGNPDTNGAIVLLSTGMSNATQEYCSKAGSLPCDAWSFTGQTLVHQEVNHDELLIANGAKGGQALATWDSPTDQNYDRVRDQVLKPMAVSESQVQIIWAKHARANPGVSLPASNADAFVLLKGLGDFVRAVKIRYPNIRQVFFSSRIYAGYASSSLNPEPFAYESGFAVKWLIEAQIRQRDTGTIDPVAGDLGNAVAPWLGWSAYLWADGENSRRDGLTWLCSDFEDDGTHPEQSAEQQVGRHLLDFFLESPYSNSWFVTGSTLPVTGTTGTLVVPASVIPGDGLTITITDQDHNVREDAIEFVIVTVVNDSSNESEIVTLAETGLNTGSFRGSLATFQSATIDKDNNGTLNVQTDDRITVIYEDDADDTGSSITLVAQTNVNAVGSSNTVIAGSVNNSSGGGGGCTLDISGKPDSSLLALLIGMLLYGCTQRNNRERRN